jgi:hypothetical protein
MDRMSWMNFEGMDKDQDMGTVEDTDMSENRIQMDVGSWMYHS